MTATKEKLLEAEYFLKCMIENQAKRDTFKFNLSAFLAAFRSVTMIMQKEFSKYPGFAAWYKKHQDTMKADNKMKLLNTKRTMTIHQQPVRPRAHINVSVTAHGTFTESVSIVVTRADGTVKRYDSVPSELPHTPAETKTTTQWLWYFEEIPEIDILTVFQECMNKLKTIVSDCEQKFGTL